MSFAPLKAIAAMSRNRVIGVGDRLPWHLPEDFKWFKKMTTGQIVVMGRKTFESLGGPLPNRRTVVLSRGPYRAEGVEVVGGLEELRFPAGGVEVFICGGSQVYGQALPYCSDLYLTLVKREVEGDAFFPPFEDRFELVGRVVENVDFDVLHYRNRRVERLGD